MSALHLEAPLVALLELPTATLRVPVMLVLCAMASNQALESREVSLEPQPLPSSDSVTMLGAPPRFTSKLVRDWGQASCQVLMKSQQWLPQDN